MGEESSPHTQKKKVAWLHNTIKKPASIFPGVKLRNAFKE